MKCLTMPKLPSFSSQRTSIIVLAILHFVGIAGMLSPWSDSFKMLTPINLLLSLFFIFRHYPKQAFIPSSIIVLGAWCAEFIGVHTGWPFGDYFYGETLGLAIAEIPVIIGVNWLILLAATHHWSIKMKLKPLQGALFTAFAMTLLDVLIEPIAIDLDFWTWLDVHVPIQNYLGWFGLAFILAFALRKILGERTNTAAGVFLFIQFIFFGLLNIFLT